MITTIKPSSIDKTIPPKPADAFSVYACQQPNLIKIAARNKLDIQSPYFAIKVDFLNNCPDKDVLKAALADFELWLANSKEGIATDSKQKAYDEWCKNEEEKRRIDEEKAATKACSDALRQEIGGALFNTDFTHPDIDAHAMQGFIEWFTESQMQTERPAGGLNAVLDGLPGVGKSRALAAAALECCEKKGRKAFEWITGYEFAEHVSNLSSDKRDEANARLKALTEAYYLFLDDLGSANFTTARTSRFFRLVDERYRRRLPIFISTNYSTAQLKKLFCATSESEEEAVRILRRIIGTPSEPLAKFFHFTRPKNGCR
jgi:DNA replication protein DnaC